MLLPLITAAALSGLLINLFDLSRGAGRQVAALERMITSQVVLESGLRRLQAGFASVDDDVENRALMAAVPVLVGRTPVSLGIENEAGKIDVMRAAEPVVLGYLSRFWERPPTRAALRAARAGGEGAGAFQAIALQLPQDELADAYRDLTRFGLQGIDPQYASRRVLESLPDLAKGEAARIAELPAGQRTLSPSASQYFVTGGHTFSLVASLASDQRSVRLPVEVSTSGRVVALAGALQ